MEKECWKCGGTGVIERYKHIENGKCFACGGDGMLSVTDRITIANDYAKKGIKSGKASHLLKVEPHLLDEPTREAYDKALRESARAMGMENIGDNYNTGILRKKMIRETGRKKNGMQPHDPKEGKTHNGMEYAGISMGILQQPGNEQSEIYTDGSDFYNREGHKIHHPLTANETFNADRNDAKILGDSKLDFMRPKLTDYIVEVQREHGKEVADAVNKELSQTLDYVEENFGGLIANTMFADGGFKVPGDSGGIGLYNLNTDGVGGIRQVNKIYIGGEFLTKAVLRKGKTDEATYQKNMTHYVDSMRATLVHELGHAYHHNALLKRNVELFAEQNVSDHTPLGNAIVHLYEDKIDELADMGIDKKTAENFFFTYDGINIDDAKKVISQFMGFYGATSSTEFYANNVEMMANPKKLAHLKEKYPEDFRLLKNTLRGVVDVEAILKNSN